MMIPKTDYEKRTAIWQLRKEHLLEGSQLSNHAFPMQDASIWNEKFSYSIFPSIITYIILNLLAIAKWVHL